MPTTTAPALPVAMLTALRNARGAEHEELARTLEACGLTPLTGGRNNDVYSWHTGAAAPVCVKVYKVDDRRRAHREWHALTALHEHGVDYAPAPLWIDDHAEQPVIAMTTVAGQPLLQAPDLPGALKAFAETTRAIQDIPPQGLLAELPRVDSVEHYIDRLVSIWPQQLADQADDPMTRDMRDLLRAWHQRGDAEFLAEPTDQLLSRGDANLENWLLTDTGAACVDFEFAGVSDAAVDAADHIEHISARAIPDDVWHSLEPNLGVDQRNRRRFEAAQRTCALRWLAVLWKQRHKRADEFAVQLDRVQRLFG